jgi:hypothetical protein
MKLLKNINKKLAKAKKPKRMMIKFERENN